MSLAADSPPHSSSSSEDFAAILASQLEEDFPDEEVEDEDEDEDEELSNDGDAQENDRAKRQKLEIAEFAEVQSSTSRIKEETDSVKSKNISEVQTSTSRTTEETGSVKNASTLKRNGVCPPHPGFFKGMCMRCGLPEEDDDSGIALQYIHTGLKLGAEEVDRLREEDLKNSLQNKKLILILDLDHTLINSTRLSDVSREEMYLLAEVESSSGDENRSLFKLGSMHMLTKLRPFVRTFLEEASHLFEMYVYTMAERPYALQIAKLLDPESVYFKSKVITQADCTLKHQKGLDVILGAESIVVIIDDTEFVWQKHRENLIVIERYHYFASSCHQFNIKTKSLSESHIDERESDGSLASILNILKRTHQMFYQTVSDDVLKSMDVRQVLKTIRGEILQGCKIVFSRLFRSEWKAEDQPIWKLAVQLGAQCETEADSSVTHVVAADAGTQKARWAKREGKFLVSASWIEAASYLWQRQKEEDFPVSNTKTR